MSIGSSRGQARAYHIARFSAAITQFQAISQFFRQNKDSGSPQSSRKDFVSRKTAIVAQEIDAERVKLINLTQMQATSLQVFELKSKTRNVLPLFRIRRKSFAIACHVTLLSVATSYRGKSSEKIVQCDTSLIDQMVSGQKPPDKNPPDINPRTKTPFAKNSPEKTYQHKIYFT